MRKEKDAFGEVDIPDDIYYGINSIRSLENFPSTGEKINPYLIKAYLQVKEACAETNYKAGLLFKEKYDPVNEAIGTLQKEAGEAIDGTSYAIYDKIVADPLQGGAGTSLNLNINEVIANKALELAGRNKGEYNFIHPIDDVNMSQSTNDTFPTALKVASIYVLRKLADACAYLQRELQNKEKEFRNVVKLGRTQMQDAVPVTLGQEFGAYAQALARDRWRLYNAEERLRSVNLGGTAAGNSIAATRTYILNVNNILNKVTGLPVAKAEDLMDATQNLDMFVEVHGIIKSNAVSLIKICNDLRFLSSGPGGGIGEIRLPAKQTGSSIMPGKINPVILENTIQVCELVKGNDTVISNAAGSGSLELNAFLPLIAHLFLKSAMLLEKVNRNLAEKCISGITADRAKCRDHLLDSAAIAASLINEFGYDTVEKIVKEAQEKEEPFIAVLYRSGLVTESELYNILSQQLGIEIE